MTQRQATTALVSAVSVTILAGCSWFGGGGGRGEDLNASRRFEQAPPVSPVRSTPEGYDQPGYIPPSNVVRQEQAAIGGVTQGGPNSSPLATPPAEPAPKDRPKSAPATPATTPPASAEPAIPETVKEQVDGSTPTAGLNQITTTAPLTETPTPPAPPAPPSAAAPTRPGKSLGSYLTLGGVVAEVNQRPIYANQVLREIVAPLSARAKELDPDQFRKVASDLINNQIQRLANNEREVAVAERNLDEKEKELARMIAARWRQRQITESGGSLELAKQRWAAEGYDFEDRVDDEYRKILVQRYYSLKVMPRVQVTADEIRRYYDQHVNDEFTEPAQVRFRVIKVDPARTGGREAALNKIKDLRARAERGEDFAAMASTVNDDKYLMSRSGDVGWVRKGQYANEQLERAVWDLQPGQVSDIVDAGGAFYIAKVEDRKQGRVAPFDEQAVQEKIVKNLKADQFRQLREKVLTTLAKNSVLRTDRDMVNTAVDIAVQNYPLWHNGTATQ